MVKEKSSNSRIFDAEGYRKVIFLDLFNKLRQKKLYKFDIIII